MVCAKKQKALFGVAAQNFEVSKKVQIIKVKLDKDFLGGLITLATNKWKNFIFPKLMKIQ